ncbi:hypothetical protein LXA43DRAFT_1180918, partial [Ganoderma leucocontextum]
MYARYLYSALVGAPTLATYRLVKVWAYRFLDLGTMPRATQDMRTVTVDVPPAASPPHTLWPSTEAPTPRMSCNRYQGLPSTLKHSFVNFRKCVQDSQRLYVWHRDSLQTLLTRHSLLSKVSRPLRSNAKPPSTNTRNKDEAFETLPTPSDLPNPKDDLSGLSGLPQVVLLIIFGLLDARALLISKGVSRPFRSLISTDMLLTYRIELAINGMVDGPPTAGLTLPERLHKLRQYSERSCTGDFTCDTDMKLGRVRLDDTTIFLIQGLNTRMPDSFGGTISYELVAGDARSLVVYAPPSIIEGTVARRWVIPLPPSGKRILAVDVTQDLVVCQQPW